MAGTVSQTLTDIKPAKGYAGASDVLMKKLTFTCVGDASNGTIPDTDTTAAITAAIKGMFVFMAIIEPGTPNPTADSDVYLEDEFGIDLLGGGAVDELDATGNKHVYPLLDAKGGSPPVIGTLTLDVDNQAVNSAQYNIHIIFSKFPMAVAGLT